MPRPRSSRRCPASEQYVLVSQDERRIEVRTRESQQWTTQIADAGESVRIHGREIAVDAI